MQLSKHFKLEEFTKSMTATRKGISNEPGSGEIKNLENLCYEILEFADPMFWYIILTIVGASFGVTTMNKIKKK